MKLIILQNVSKNYPKNENWSIIHFNEIDHNCIKFESKNNMNKKIVVFMLPNFIQKLLEVCKLVNKW